MSIRRNHPFLSCTALLLPLIGVGFISGVNGRYTLRGKLWMGFYCGTAPNDKPRDSAAMENSPSFRRQLNG